MNAWGLFLAPLLAAEAAADRAPGEPVVMELPSGTIDSLSEELLAPTEALDGDVFAGLAPLDQTEMSAASGGSHTAIDISHFGMNAAANEGDVENVNVNNSSNGQIANNVVSDNGGITTVFNNTGNGVVFQSNVNVNVFLQD